MKTLNFICMLMTFLPTLFNYQSSWVVIRTLERWLICNSIVPACNLYEVRVALKIIYSALSAVKRECRSACLRGFVVAEREREGGLGKAKQDCICRFAFRKELYGLSSDVSGKFASRKSGLALLGRLTIFL
jgi:hypothetical protein